VALVGLLEELPVAQVLHHTWKNGKKMVCLTSGLDKCFLTKRAKKDKSL